jgi:hypothetical protein
MSLAAKLLAADSPFPTLVREQLALYGLNPEDWNLQTSKSMLRENVIRIRNRRDHDFKMKAKLEHSKCGAIKITELSLLSI